MQRAKLSGAVLSALALAGVMGAYAQSGTEQFVEYSTSAELELVARYQREEFNPNPLGWDFTGPPVNSAVSGLDGQAYDIVPLSGRVALTGVEFLTHSNQTAALRMIGKPQLHVAAARWGALPTSNCRRDTAPRGCLQATQRSAGWTLTQTAQADTYVTGIAVCTENAANNTNVSIQGIRLNLARVSASGQLSPVAQHEQGATAACAQWHPVQSCPAGAIAVGVRAIGNSPATYRGASLVCRPVGPPGPNLGRGHPTWWVDTATSSPADLVGPSTATRQAARYVTHLAEQLPVDVTFRPPTTGTGTRAVIDGFVAYRRWGGPSPTPVVDFEIIGRELSQGGRAEGPRRVLASSADSGPGSATPQRIEGYGISSLGGPMRYLIGVHLDRPRIVTVRINDAGQLIDEQSTEIEELLPEYGYWRCRTQESRLVHRPDNQSDDRCHFTPSLRCAEGQVVTGMRVDHALRLWCSPVVRTADRPPPDDTSSSTRPDATTVPTTPTTTSPSLPGMLSMGG